MKLTNVARPAGLVGYQQNLMMYLRHRRAGLLSLASAVAGAQLATDIQVVFVTTTNDQPHTHE
jgi:hypothetical protein